jgi:Coenzyme PQQ synthesis protein D (PqqD)
VKRRDLAPEWTPHDSVTPGVMPRRRDGVHGVELDDESVLYDARTDRLHLLNWSASAVWWSIDGRATVDELAQLLAQRFHAEAGVMATDVRKLLEVLGAQRLVEAARTREAARA